jgi:hypothetical protein
MNVPDYIAPIVGYRTWHWGSLMSPLKSLNNNEPWLPGRPLAAKCKLYRAGWRPNHQKALDICSCGVCALKSPDRLRVFPVYGEVYLWGKVVEHECGWRAEYAYPKLLILSPPAFPGWGPTLISKEENESRVRPLPEYGVAILLEFSTGDTVPLWCPGSGYDREAQAWMRGYIESVRWRMKVRKVFRIVSRIGRELLSP